MKKVQIILRTVALITVTIFVFSTCKKNGKVCEEHTVTACSEDPAKTNLRIKNISKYNFCNVEMAASSNLVNCGIINKGEQTCYRSYDTAYSYAYIHLNINDKEFTFQPEDFVGEQPLGAGKFTYLLDITDYNSGFVSIKLQRD